TLRLQWATNIQEIAKLNACCDDTARKTIARLEAAGWITTQSGFARTGRVIRREIVNHLGSCGVRDVKQVKCCIEISFTRFGSRIFQPVPEYAVQVMEQVLGFDDLSATEKAVLLLLAYYALPNRTVSMAFEEIAQQLEMGRSSVAIVTATLEKKRRLACDESL